MTKLYRKKENVFGKCVCHDVVSPRDFLKRRLSLATRLLPPIWSFGVRVWGLGLGVGVELSECRVED